MRPVTLGYNPEAQTGKIIRTKSNGTKYNTSLQSEKGGTMQASCPCFTGGSTTQGACAGHFADANVRLFAAEAVLVGAEEKIAALEAAFHALGQVSLRCQGDSRGFLHALEEVFALRGLPADKLRPKEQKS